MAGDDILVEYWRYRANKARATAANPIGEAMQQEIDSVAAVYDYLADIAARCSAPARSYSSHSSGVDRGWKIMLDPETNQLQLKLEGYQALLAATSDAAEIGALTKLIAETEQRLSVLNKRSSADSTTRSSPKSS